MSSSTLNGSQNESKQGAPDIPNDNPTDGTAQRQPPGPPEPEEYPRPLVFGINMFAMYLAVFCLALDYTILATAIPTITNQFHALDDVGWYASGMFALKTE